MKTHINLLKRLSFQFGVVLVFLSVIPLVIIAINLIGVNKTGIESAMMELYSSTAKLAASEVDTFVKEKRVFATELSEPFDTDLPDVEYTAIETLKNAFSHDPSLIRVTVYDVVVGEIFALERGISTTDNEVYTIDENNIASLIESGIRSDFISESGLSLVTINPVNPTKLVIVVNDASSLELILNEHRFGRSGAACLIDANGNGLYQSEYDDLPFNIAEYSNEAQVLSLIENRIYGASEGKTDDGQRVLTAFVPTLNYSGGIIIHQLYDDAYFSSVMLQRTSIITVIIVALIAIVIAMLFSSYLSRPISQLGQASRKLAEGDFEVNIKTRRKDEMGGLISTFNEMVRSLKEKVIIESAMHRYLSKDVANYIIERPDMLQIGGAEMTISAMFVDIRDFVSQVSDMNPKDLVKFLNYQHSIMTDIVFKHHGTLDKFVGDGLIVLFGAPIDLDEFSYLAVLTACEIQRTVKDNPKLKPVGISITTGPVVVGNMGSVQRMEYTAIGRPMNLASRLESEAKGGEIVIDEETYKSVAKYADVDGPYSKQIKGFVEPITYYKVKSLRGEDDDA